MKKIKKIIFFLKKILFIVILKVNLINFVQANNISAIRIGHSNAYTRMTIESSKYLNYKYFTLLNPKRLVIDFENVSLKEVLKFINKKKILFKPNIELLRIGQFNKKTVRFVFKNKKKIFLKTSRIDPINHFKFRSIFDFYFDDKKLNNQKNNLVFKKNHFLINKKKHQPIIIMIDPGHGGQDPGAIGYFKSTEKKIVLEVSKKLKYFINKEPYMKGYLTREYDVFVPLNTRIEKAKKVKADFFISIHADAFTNRNAKGSSIFALSKKGATSNLALFLSKTQNSIYSIDNFKKSGDKYLDHTIFDLVQTATIRTSLKFGAEILNQIKKINTLHKKNVEQSTFQVLKSPGIPSILIELDFISNKKEEKKLNNINFQKQIAKSIFLGIQSFYTKYYL
ncbi:MAG: N-acetylmuramoyl-L-alanine amidase [Arsenophonus sp.]|nr:MAG: N-acetylmuramoyl-L-alanine amidase [Arsenophonus sp.]